VLLGIAVLAGIYWIARSGGHWADSDSSFMASAIRAVVSEARLIPDEVVYPSGYGYQVISATVVAFTGIEVAALQQYVYPLLAAFVILSAWVAYRELLSSSRLATIAALLLLLVPGHLFSLLRGSHEPLDRILVFATLWLILRGIRVGWRPSNVAVYLGLALAMTYALVATNVLFGISFVGAVGAALVGSWVLQWGPPTVRPLSKEVVRHLSWFVAQSVLLIGAFILFIYPPAGFSLRQLFTVAGGAASAVVSEVPDASPYAGVLASWVSPEVYVLLSLGEYLLIGGSGLVWIWQGWRWLRGTTPLSLGSWLLWLMYAAFAAQLVVTVLSDRAGAVASNLQYRTFTVYAAIAAAVLAQGLAQLRAVQWRRATVRFAVALFAVAALLKATNEPILSNEWTFYTRAEFAGMEWTDRWQRSSISWVGPRTRLANAYALEAGRPQWFNRWAFGEPAPDVRAYLISDAIRLHSARLGVPVPAVGPHNLVYDSGAVQVYRTRAQGAFER